jgi:hypothetical protein
MILGLDNGIKIVVDLKILMYLQEFWMQNESGE